MDGINKINFYFLDQNQFAQQQKKLEQEVASLLCVS